MPQASDELRAMWPGGDNEALAYLKKRGIKEERNGMLVVPNGFDLSDMDVSAIRYLLDEWDFSWRQIGNDGSNE